MELDAGGFLFTTMMEARDIFSVSNFIRPDPRLQSAQPYESPRVIHSLAGTILIDSEQKRLKQKVAGASYESRRVRLRAAGAELTAAQWSFGAKWRSGPQQWKDRLHQHSLLRGELSDIQETISKEQYERRSDFLSTRSPSDLSLSDAEGSSYFWHPSASSSPP